MLIVNSYSVLAQRQNLNRFLALAVTVENEKVFAKAILNVATDRKMSSS